MAFAENLKALRLANNMTQETVARHVNLSRSTIAGYEAKNRQPSYEILSAFVKLFHVSIDELLKDDVPVLDMAGTSAYPADGSDDFLTRYRRLPEPSRKILVEHLRLLEIQAGIKEQ